MRHVAANLGRTPKKQFAKFGLGLFLSVSCRGTQASELESDATSAPTRFRTSCKATLNGQIKINAASELFENDINGYSNSLAKIDLSPYILNASVSMARPFGSPAMEATLEVSLYKGNPMTGSINSARIQGLDLSHRPVNAPLAVYGTNFVEFDYNQMHISRIDYNCAITRVP